jgi:hypothetical protein
MYGSPVMMESPCEPFVEANTGVFYTAYLTSFVIKSKVELFSFIKASRNLERFQHL